MITNAPELKHLWSQNPAQPQWCTNATLSRIVTRGSWQGLGPPGIIRRLIRGVGLAPQNPKEKKQKWHPCVSQCYIITLDINNKYTELQHLSYNTKVTWVATCNKKLLFFFSLISGTYKKVTKKVKNLLPFSKKRSVLYSIGDCYTIVFSLRIYY